MKLFRWIGSFFEDQDGSASSKRLFGAVSLGYLGMIVNGSLNGKVVNEWVLYAVTLIILFSVGAITSEFITKYGIKKNDNAAK